MSQESKDTQHTNIEEENIEYQAFSEELESSENISADNAEETISEADSFAEENQDAIQILQEQLDKTKEQMIRALAEAENTRKRAIKDKEDATRFAISRFSKDLLPVADNLKRALDSIPADLLEEHDALKNLVDGIQATERELLRCFETNGIEKVEPLDQPFDPNFHEVMFEAPIPEKQAGTIIQVIEPGYVLNGRILRPARVGIAKNMGTANESPSEPGQTINTEA